MGTEKRERQKTARYEKIVAEQTAAKRDRTKRTVFRAAAAAVVLIGGVFAYTVFFGDDGDETETADETDTSTPTTEPPLCETPAEPTPGVYTNPDLANQVLARTAPDAAPPPAETAPDALEVTTVIEGEGEGAAVCDTVVVHYVGKTADGATFDESWSTGQTFPVGPIGEAQVITGWNDGLVGAKVGERRRLVIGSENGYGAQGNPPIPPDAPLAFEIDIVDVVKPGTTSSTTAPTDTTVPPAP